MVLKAKTKHFQKIPMDINKDIQGPPVPDAWAIATDVVQHVRQQWPEVGSYLQAEALLIALYGVGGPAVGACVLAAACPTAVNK